MTKDRQPPRAVALVGMPGAGKSVCADYLEQQGYYKFRFGQIVVDEVAQRGMLLTPANERIVRESLREAEGINAIAQRALPYLTNALEQHQTIIIDGLYGFGEYKLLNAQLGASMALRYARLTERSERPLTVEEAIERDFREIDHLEKGGPIAIADYTLLNNGATEALLASLEGLIGELGVAP